MNNFINHRIQAINFSATLKSFKHNLRVEDTLSQINNKKNIVLIPGENGKLEVKTFNYIKNKDLKKLPLESQEKYHNDRKEILNFFHKMKDNIPADREEHKAKYKKRNKRELITDAGTYAEGVLTFSEQLKVDLENKTITMNDFLKAGADAINSTCKILGTELLYITLHLDETTPHFHYCFKNYNDKGASITHNQHIKKRLIETGVKTDIDTKDTLTYLQNIAHNHFEKFGIERGIKKEFTGANYESASNWHKKQKQLHQKELNETKAELKKVQELVKNIKTEYKNASGADFTTIEEYNNWVNNLKLERDAAYVEINDLKAKINALNVEINALNVEISTIQDNKLLEQLETNKLIKQQQNILEYIAPYFSPETTIKTDKLINEHNNMINFLKQKGLLQEFLDYDADNFDVFSLTDLHSSMQKLNNSNKEVAKTLINNNPGLRDALNSFRNLPAAAQKQQLQALTLSKTITKQEGTRTITTTLTTEEIDILVKTDLEDIN